MKEMEAFLSGKANVHPMTDSADEEIEVEGLTDDEEDVDHGEHLFPGLFGLSSSKPWWMG